MKHNGQNIITDKDITITGDGFQGEELSGVLSDHQNRLDTLESNVKWIYKNGGVGTGSGSGGSGGSSTSWKIVVSRSDTGQTLLDNSEISFAGKGNYSIKVQIYRGGTSTFRVRYNWKNTNGAQTRTAIVSKDNSFYTEQQLLLNENGTLSITVLNQDTQEPVVFNISYIVTPYEFKLYYVYSDTKTEFLPTNGNIFMSDVKDRGIMAALSYNVSVDLQSAWFTFTDWEEVLHDSREMGDEYIIQQRSHGIIYLDLTSNIISYLNNNANAKFIQFSLNIDLVLAGNVDKENISTLYLRDNLIPSGMYLKVQTSGGGLYNTSQLEDGGVDPDTGEPIIINNYPESERFSVGNGVFQVTPYYNAFSPSRTYSIVVRLNNVIQEITTTTLLDQQTRSISIPLVTGGQEYKITFRIQAEDRSYEKDYYLYVKEATSKFTWYPANVGEGLYSSYYRQSLEVVNIPGLNFEQPIRMSVNSNNQILPFTVQNPPSDLSGLDQLLCLGIQLSSINDDNEKIVSFKCDQDNGTIDIYQNKLVLHLGSSVEYTTDIYIPTVHTLNENGEFHLISIYKNFEHKSGPNYWKRLYIYIDGILESAISQSVTVHSRFEELTLFKGNYLVNLIECSCFIHQDNAVTTTWLSHNDILKFYFTYKEKVLREDIEDADRELALLDNFDQFKLTSDNHVTVSDYAIIENIAENSDIPILVLDHSDISGGGEFNIPGGYDVDNFKNWMDRRYSESSGGRLEKIEVTARWCGKGEKTLREIVTPDNNPARFKITPQGSSTLGYHCKNWELFAPESNSEQTTYVYTPNFVYGDYETFLPEESFTLKADVVDSSHTNNNAIGSFVNYVTTPFANARPNDPSATEDEKVYNKYIKNCLTGFPVLVFVRSMYKSNVAVSVTDKTNIYFLGIYNFNLGRQSYFNLGYKKATIFSKYGLTSGFHIYEISNFDNTLLSGVGVAEIQGNGPMFDFSQFDSSVLFKLFDSDDHYMFGDLVSGTTEATLKNKLQSLLRKTSRAGGYTFASAGKLFKNTKSPEDVYGYGYDEGYSAVDSETGLPKRQVPNYKYQAVRSYSGTSEVYEFSEIQGGDATEKDLTDLIFGDTNIEAPEYGPTLDYKSLCEYYTVCMAFGLVDSVQKNLNIKTWDVGNDIPLWYLAFYDMDTSLGVSNSGSKISYFAFSDYWKSNTASDGSLLQATVYRDYSPKGDDTEESGFYDIASSYIFAVAKYAYNVLNKNEAFIMHPSNLWGIWRNSSTDPEQNPQRGCLRDADEFINNFYIHHLNDVPLAAFNYNYSYKYIVKDTDSESLVDTDFEKFYGRKIYYTKNWLEGRLHLLDAYFNINGLTDTLSSGIEAPYTNPAYRDNTNPDIFVLRDIFSTVGSEGKQYPNLNSIVRIKTRPYSPLILSTANGGSRYIFPDVEDCLVKLETYGNQFLLLGGSSLWESISSIVPFITSNKSISITSDYFTELVGDRLTCTQWSLKIPSIKNIRLTSAGYSGNLEFRPDGSEESNPYPNLNSIDISNTSIRLTVDSSNITTLTAKNMKGGDIAIINTLTLTNVDLSGSELNTISIPAWSNNITLNNLKCTRLEILANTKFPTVNINISNNTTLERVSVANAETLTISNCEKLKEIEFKENGVIKQLRVTGSDPNSFKIYTLGTSIADGTVDLSGQTNLTTILLRDTQVSKLILPNRPVDLLPNAFRDCKKLQYLDGGGSYTITGAYTFYNCEKFTLKQSNGNWSNIKISNNITSLNRTFAIDYYTTSSGHSQGSLDLDAAIHFLDVCCNISNNKVANIDYLFYNQNIEYSYARMLEEYTEGVCSLNFDKLPNVTSLSSTLFNNPIYAYNRYMFRGLTKNNISLQYLLGVNTGRVWDEKSGSNNIVYITEDFLYEIIDKLSIFRGVINDSGRLCFCVIDPETGEKLETVRLESVFNPISNSIQKFPVRLSTLSAIDFDNTQKIDFSNTFKDSWTTAATTGLEVYSIFSRYSYPNVIDGSLNELFKNIALKSIAFSFVSIGVSQTTGHFSRVNMRTFINWDKINLCRNLFVAQNNYLEYLSSINFKKEVTKEDFWYIWSKILSDFTPSGSFVGVGYLFSNCNINYWDGEDNRFSLVDPNDVRDLRNEKIVNIPNLFSNCRVFRETESSSSISPLFMTYDSYLFKNLPKIETAYSVFKDTYWKNTVPFDFFQKRVEEIREVFVVSEENTVIPATRYTYSYNKEIDDLRSCFSDVHLQSARGFYETDDYNCGKLDLTAEECMRTRIIGEDGNYYNEYYLNSFDISTSTPTPIRLSIPNEELDLLNLTGTYSSSVVITGAGVNQLRNPIPSIESGAENLLFVSPDIFNGCKTTCRITNAFSNTLTPNEDGDNGNYVFTGLIPEHLLSAVKSANITNMMLSLNILPRYLGSTTDSQGTREDYYCYIPSNFTNNASLENSFNFKLILPNNNQHFYIFLHDSIPTATERLTNSLPTCTSDRLFDVGYRPWYSDFKSIQYHIMGTIMRDSVTGEFNGVTSGLDLQVFNKLKLDELISYGLASVLAGDIFLNFPTIWNNKDYLEIKNANGIPTSYVMRIGYNAYGGLSSACKLTLPEKNENFVYGLSSYEKGSVINPNSVYNYNELSDDDKLTYNEKNVRFYTS